MEYKYFFYPLYIWFMHFVGYMLTFIFLGAFLWALYINPSGFFDEVRKNLFYTIVVFPAVNIFVMFLSLHWPNIRINQNGLEVSVYFLWVKIPWKDVKSVHRMPPDSYRGIDKVYVVRVNHLTPIHYLFGLVTSFEFAPCFLINSQLSGYTELVAEIRKQTHRR